MLIPPSDVPEQVSAGVAVAGGGIAGLSLARALARAGVDVAVLEAGAHDETAFSRDLARAEAVGPHHVAPDGLGSRRLGGGSWSWGGRCLDADPADFAERPADEAPGWPIGHAELTAERAEAARLLEIGEPSFGAGLPLANGCRGPGCVLERWSARPRLPGLRSVSPAGSPGVRVFLGLACTRVALDAEGRAIGLEARTAEGRRITVTARAYVVAAGGIETARLLLWSFEALPPNARPPWLGRGYMGHLIGSMATVTLPEAVKRALDYERRPDRTCHTRRRLVLPRETLRAEGLFNIGFHIGNPDLRDPSHGSAPLSAMALALRAPVVGRAVLPQALRDVLVGEPLTRAELARHWANLARAPLSAAATVSQALAGRMSRPLRPGVVPTNPAGRYALWFNAEQPPRHGASVSLGWTRDPAGVPRPVIAHVLGRAEIDSAIRAHEVLGRAIEDAGLGRLELVAPAETLRREGISDPTQFGQHQIGTARMGTDRRTGVVDTDARVHGVANLYVAGSAVFPRGGQANPTFLIVCQALRLAAHLARVLR